MSKNNLPQSQSAPNVLYLTLDGVSQLYYMLNQEEYMKLQTKASNNTAIDQLPQESTPAEESEEEYITRDKVAELLHVDKSTLWRWEKEGRLTSIKVGSRRVLYKSEDVKRFLDNNNNV